LTTPRFRTTPHPGFLCW